MGGAGAGVGWPGPGFGWPVDRLDRSGVALRPGFAVSREDAGARMIEGGLAAERRSAAGGPAATAFGVRSPAAPGPAARGRAALDPAVRGRAALDPAVRSPAALDPAAPSIAAPGQAPVLAGNAVWSIVAVRSWGDDLAVLGEGESAMRGNGNGDGGAGLGWPGTSSRDLIRHVMREGSVGWPGADFTGATAAPAQTRRRHESGLGWPSGKESTLAQRPQLIAAFGPALPSSRDVSRETVDPDSNLPSGRRPAPGELVARGQVGTRSPRRMPRLGGLLRRRQVGWHWSTPRQCRKGRFRHLSSISRSRLSGPILKPVRPSGLRRRTLAGLAASRERQPGAGRWRRSTGLEQGRFRPRRIRDLFQPSGRPTNSAPL